MTKTETAEITKALNDLRTVVKDSEKVTPKRIAITASMLNEYPYPVVRAAIRAISAEATFFPAAAEIVQRIRNDSLFAEDSWRRVLLAVRNFGIYDESNARASIKAEDWSAVEAIGGWRALCNCEEKELSFIGSQFKKAARVYSARRAVEKYLPQGQTVAGYLEGTMDEE